MECFSVNLSTRLGFRGLQIHISGTPYVKFYATTFCTLVKLGKKLSLCGGLDHAGLMKEYSIQWHMILKFCNSYDIFLDKFRKVE